MILVFPLPYSPQFVYMAKGLDTMIQENPKDDITESSGLQLGTANTIIDSPAIKPAEDEFADLTIKNGPVALWC